MYNGGLMRLELASKKRSAAGQLNARLMVMETSSPRVEEFQAPGIWLLGSSASWETSMMGRAREAPAGSFIGTIFRPRARFLHRGERRFSSPCHVGWLPTLGHLRGPHPATGSTPRASAFAPSIVRASSVASFVTDVTVMKNALSRKGSAEPING